jgi:amino acid transporter
MSESPYPFIEVSLQPRSSAVSGHNPKDSMDAKVLVESTAPTQLELTAHKQVFLASTNSRAATVAMSTVPLVLSVCTSLNALAAGSRQIWSLARDQALPFSSWFRKVSLISNWPTLSHYINCWQVTTLGTPIPLNSILASLSITILLALINIG